MNAFVRVLAGVAATAAEIAEPRPGDWIVPRPDVVMDRAFTVPGSPARVWPWLVQLGKRRAGWYLPRAVERYLPPTRRAIRRLDARWAGLDVGDVIPDYGGRHETFTVASVDPPRSLVYRSRRGHAEVSWSIVLRPDDVAGVERTRVRTAAGADPSGVVGPDGRRARRRPDGGRDGRRAAGAPARRSLTTTVEVSHSPSGWREICPEQSSELATA